MTARLLEGKPVAAEILDDVSTRSGILRSRGIQPTLVCLSIGDSAPWETYVRTLTRLGSRHGIEVRQWAVPAETARADFAGELRVASAEPSIDSVLVQAPLPPPLSWSDVADALDPRKDVDGMTIVSSGRLYLGLPGPRPSTAVAMMTILQAAGIQLAGRHAVVLGRSPVVGHPVAELALREHATVTVTHSRTRDLVTLTRHADVLFAAVGKPRMVAADILKPGVVIVDAGINVHDGGIVGDVDFEGAVQVASAITPVPGGVGPVTNAILLRGVVESAERRPV